LYNTDKKATFTPHLTIAKTSKTSGRKQVKMIHPKSYEDHKDDSFGNQSINTLELLSMTLPADKDGYYHCFSRESFNISHIQGCIGDVKQSTDDIDDNKREDTTMISAPCTAVKFIPRIIRKQDEPMLLSNTTNTTNVVPSTHAEMDKTEET